MYSTYCDKFKVDSSLFKDCASTSHGVFGSFTGSIYNEVCLLRSMDTIELYQVTQSLSMLSEYKMANQKVKDMCKVRLPWFTQKDLLCVHVQGLRFVMLCFDEEIQDWSSVCLFNFDHTEELKQLDKRFPMFGMLNPITTSSSGGFLFLADDTMIGSVKFQQKKPQLQKSQDHSTAQMNADYINIVGGPAFSQYAISDIVKPLRHFQLKEHGIIQVIDIKPFNQEGNNCQLVVLHQGDLDKLVGTKARYPVCKLTTFELADRKLTPLFTIDQLSQYCRQIIPAADYEHFYVLTQFSFYLVRNDRQRITEIQTSTGCQALNDNWNRDTSKPYAPVSAPGQVQFERSKFDTKQSSLKFDRCRLLPLKDNKILLATTHGEFKLITLKFDQAEIDIAEVTVQRLDIYERRVASSLCATDCNSLVLVTSHFQATSLMSLKAVENGLEVDQKRQKVAADQGFAGKRKNYQMHCLDELPCLSPITDLMQMPTLNNKPGEDLFGLDFIVSHGDHVESYITYAASRLPLIFEPHSSQQQAERIYKLSESLVLTTNSNSSKVLDVNEQPVQLDYVTDEATLFVCENLQITKTKASNGTKTLELQGVVSNICFFQGSFYLLFQGNVFMHQLGAALDNPPIQLTKKASLLTASPGHLISFHTEDLQLWKMVDELKVDATLENVTRQPCILARDYKGESITDPSYKHVVESQGDLQQPNAQLLTFLQHFKLKDLQCLMMQRADGQKMLYVKMPNQAYKLMQSNVLLGLDDQVVSVQSYQHLAFVICQKRPFVVVEKHRKIKLVRLSTHNGQPLKSIVKVSQAYLGTCGGALLSIKTEKGFDFTHNLYSDGFIMKQVQFESKGIRSMTKFRPFGVQVDCSGYLAVATFTLKQPKPLNNNFEMGFTSETKAPDVAYQIEIYKLPTCAADLSYFQQEPLIEKFDDNKIINHVGEVTLEIAGMENTFKNYLAVCSIRVDTSRRTSAPSEEKGFYSSSLILYQVREGKISTQYVDSQTKRSITCVSSFLGRLVCSISFKNWQDLCLVLWKFNEKKNELEDAKAIPNGAVKNLATCISYDQDFLVLGDTIKNLTVLKKSNAEENHKQKQDSNELHIIKYTKNDLDVNVVGAFSMSRHLSFDRTDFLKRVDAEGQSFGRVHMMSDQSKRMLNVMGFSNDGYARMYKIRESKQLDVFAQLNLQDKILAVRPLHSSRDELCERRLAVVTQRSGVHIVTPCSDKEYYVLEALTKLMSNTMPFRGGLTPLHALIEPCVPVYEIKQLNQRMNGNAVNLTTSLGDFPFLNTDLQEYLATQCGYNLSTLRQII